MLSRKSAKSNAQVTLKFTLIEKVQKNVALLIIDHFYQ